MIIKAEKISGRSRGWLKKITATTVNLQKMNGYSLIGNFHNYDEAVVINPGDYFVVDSGKGRRKLYNDKGEQISKEERREIQEKAGFSEQVIASIENSLLYDFGAYVVAVAKLKEPEKPINPLEKFTKIQLVEELQNRGHDVKLDDRIFPKIIKAEKAGRFAALEME